MSQHRSSDLGPSELLETEEDYGYGLTEKPSLLTRWGFKIAAYKNNFILAASLIILFLVIVLLCMLGAYMFIGSDSGKVITDARGKNCLPIPSFKFDFDEDKNYTQHQPIQSVKQVVVTNAIIISTSDPDAQGKVKIRLVDLLFEDGKIKQIADGGVGAFNGLSGAKTVDVGSRFVTTGLVDMHSHLGVYSEPIDGNGHSDGNEVTTNPTTPMVRAVDAVNPKDVAIPIIRQLGGVTTSLVLPGSANVMGGEGVYLKLKTESKTVSEMLIKDAPRTLKMACGENPKRVYGSQHIMPDSRMGAAWVMRKIFQQASNLIKEQDVWDCNEDIRKTTPNRPFDLSLEPIVGLLRGVNITLNVHCYEVQDLEMTIRLSKEFNFTINAFHHALEAYHVADLIQRNHITIATFADLFGYKLEAYEASVNAPVILRSKNVRVALKSDHPVIHAKYLLMNAAKSHYYGLDESSALNSVTSVPAEAIGLGNRLGKLEEGFDADVVVWDRFPLLLGARPHQIYIDGNLVDDFNLPIHSTDDHVKKSNEKMEITISQGGDSKTTKTEEQYCSYNPENFGAKMQAGYSIKGAKIYTMDENNKVISDGNIVVDTNGVISCVGTEDECTIPNISGHVTYSLDGGVVIPGLVESSTSLGLYEIEAEPVTQDGASSGVSSSDMLDVESRFGVRMRSRNIRAAWKAGITTTISHRQGRMLLNGQSSAFTLDGFIVSDSILNNSVALYLTFGAYSKDDGSSSSISTQVSFLRKTFKEASHDVIKRVLAREIPVSAMVNQADDIGQLVELKKEFGFDLIIIGGAEAYLVADLLKANNVPVILTPVSEELSDKIYWETQRSKNNFGASELFAAGVKLGIGVGNSAHDVRNLRFIAGLVSQEAQKESSITFIDALASVTKTISEIFKLGPGVGSIRVNTKANFVLFDENPLTFSGLPKVIAVGQTTDCSIKQF